MAEIQKEITHIDYPLLTRNMTSRNYDVLGGLRSLGQIRPFLREFSRATVWHAIVRYRGFDK